MFIQNVNMIFFVRSVFFVDFPLPDYESINFSVYKVPPTIWRVIDSSHLIAFLRNFYKFEKLINFSVVTSIRSLNLRKSFTQWLNGEKKSIEPTNVRINCALN